MVGYERHRDNRRFAQHLSVASVERVIDIRELPDSRRYALRDNLRLALEVEQLS